LGAAIAILSPVLIDNIQRQRQAKRIKAVLALELHEVRYRLVLIAGQLRQSLGQSNRKHIQWQLAALAAYRGPNRIPDVEAVFTQMLSHSDADLTQAFEISRQRGENTGFRMKPYTAPYLEAHLHVFADFALHLQIALLDFKQYLELYNAEVDIANGHFALTFELNGANHQIASQNLQKSYQNLARMAVGLVGKANTALSLIDPSWKAIAQP
jgi:hypothetical protein